MPDHTPRGARPSPLRGRYVAVCGPADSATEEHRRQAYAVGHGLGEAGAVVLTGGHHGVMDAAARGATDAGGTAIGILPGTDRTEGSPHHTFLLPTGLGELRNPLLIRSADAVVAVGCSWGTLSEIALARRTGVPLVLLDPWDLPDDVGVVAEDPASALGSLARLLVST